MMSFALFGDAAIKSFCDLFAGQIAANKDDAAIALFVRLPGPLVIAVKDHVHALKDEALLVTFESKDAFAAQNVWAFLLHQILHPGKESVGVERLIGVQRNRLHFLVMIVLEPAMRMRVIMIVPVIMPVVVIIMVVMVMIVAAEEIRFKVKDPIEIEGVAAEHRIERDLGTLRLVQFGIRIDAANARLDLAQFIR
jgi:hypothetical protein